MPNAAATAWHWATGPPTSASGIQLPAGVNAGRCRGPPLHLHQLDRRDHRRRRHGRRSGERRAARDEPHQQRLPRQRRHRHEQGHRLRRRSGRRPPSPKQAQAPYTIGALNVKVSAGKTISPSRIPAGTDGDRDDHRQERLERALELADAQRPRLLHRQARLRRVLRPALVPDGRDRRDHRLALLGRNPGDRTGRQRRNPDRPARRLSPARTSPGSSSSTPAPSPPA